MLLLTLLAAALLAGLTAAALLVCLAKWNVLAAWQVHAPRWLPRY